MVVENEWGRIEEITLTYVVLHVWDDRRLILPSTYFTTTPFQNWTRTEAAVLGEVTFEVDWAVPVAAVRTRLHEVLEASDLWDGRVGVLQVTDAVGSFVTLRVLVSGRDGPTVFDLRCEVREALVGWLQSEHPQALPRMRYEQAAPAPRSNPDRPATSPRPVAGQPEPDASDDARMFTGSLQAVERSRVFTGPDSQPVERVQPDDPPRSD
ncbi:hypothetical protein GCM10025868_26480 [Angustibacter aerolatus]|uniref:Mechanosensitive ion channel MscS domain-containing protein n=1 Tax=Angustibacter aerolatus TaxID=1162965 RepID=A0ABQ6JGS8_9ACTN|nr:hypothetical protein GCM10025868_26480 [Angustibacter aerolatus]